MCFDFMNLRGYIIDVNENITKYQDYGWEAKAF